MRLTLAILATLSIGSDALAMGGPVYIDETCDRITEAPATPALKAWIKKTCPQGETSSDPICADLSRFVRAVAANNQNWRAACEGKR
ncbi:hypothetical protein IY145_10800 [Methylosinus sp. H3A]|uniref:hypothetical protein n=1 Tax=Methylosinus sp. H3A TaxID=2785786 RepID=UPI0018C2096C|nr:hypothetical protein [Methylosinus sp. H3A]MBG0809867.1 hypothetical protein [Methylosinus sp. H3A]